MIADEIQRANMSLEERGLPPDSFFELEFSDGSKVTEKEVNWSSMAEERRVRYFGDTKTVYACTVALGRITVRHGALTAVLEVPAGYTAFQAVRSETAFIGGRREVRVLGRILGLIRGDEVVEERFLNGVQNEVQGRRN